MNILETKNITKSFTGHRALDDVSIAVPEGSVYGLLGPNGAGKTTLIRIINHITAPDEGEVIFDGKPLVADDVQRIGYLPEERGLYKKMKVGEQAVFFARLKGLSKADATARLKKWFERMEIDGWWDKKVQELSKGMAQKVQFIITVLHEPKLLIFDEPFSGFDPINANLLKREILQLRDNGATVIFSTHNMSSVEELCDNITLINKSRNVLTGNVAELRHEFGARRYTFVFNGAHDVFAAAAAPFIEQAEEPVVLKDGSMSVVLTLTDDEALRPMVDTVNRAVNLRSFAPLLPSMDNIFIAAVNNSKQ